MICVSDGCTRQALPDHPHCLECRTTARDIQVPRPARPKLPLPVLDLLAGRDCSTPGCTRPTVSRGCCDACYKRAVRSGAPKKGRHTTTERANEDLYMVCPDTLEELAGAVATIDARRIARLLWDHIGDASFAGRQPFTLGPLTETTTATANRARGGNG